MIPKDNVVVPIIQEFYASLRDQESRNIEGRTWDMVLVWGKKVRLPLKLFVTFIMLHTMRMISLMKLI
ncbi:hypothetical protein Goshw_020118 [Gossypium schwendimanii]|uniref:Uncharacterized protein n=1 Tax=Gossypium schwendimanii TaxID=34291 RepID=A0A7J9L4K8_GOSSC|nr:hypothetical protein [Gossypium schwendimanii]